MLLFLIDCNTENNCENVFTQLLKYFNNPGLLKQLSP